MKLTEEVLSEIVAKSSTFDERLANGYFIPHPEPNESEINRRLDRWCEVAAKGDRDQFQRLLAIEGLDLGSIKAALGPVRLSDQAELPKWTDLLQDGLKAAARPPESFRFLDANERWPFEQIVAPFVDAASERLRAKRLAGYDLLADKAKTSLERTLLHWLVNVCGSALFLEFSIFRLKRQKASGQRFPQLQADTSSEIYREYVGHMLGGGLVPFLQEYSVLARAITILIKNWVETTAEFLTRLTSDWSSIGDTFQMGRALGQVEELGAGLSDPHRGGRSVFALTFFSGLKLIYKPKSLETEEAYTRLVKWINQHDLSLQVKGLHVLSRAGYGWAEFVEHAVPVSDAERARFYRRSGMLLCLFYVLGATDVHAENLIAAGEHPVLVDAETLITPSLDDNQSRESDEWAETIARRRMNTSVLRVGMLPWFRSRSGQVYDLSALGGVGGEEALATAWQGIETDNLKRQVVTGKIPRNRNVPFATDEEAELTRYVEEVVAGFREMYNLLLTQRGSLLNASSPLDELVRSPMRLVFRDTSTYFSILKNSVDATLLRDGAERSIHLDLLSRVLLVSDSNVRFMPFLRAEKQALTELDIPFFTVHPKGSDMDLGFGKTVKNCFTQTGYQCIREKVLGLGEQDLEQQIGIIRGSFWAKASAQLSTTDGDAVRQVGSINLVPAGAVELLEEAIKIGQQLEGKALCGKDGSLTWIGLASHLNAQTSHFGQVGAALFDGLAGVALFLAALEKATGDAKWRQMAKGTFATIRRSVAAIETNLRTRRQSALQNVPLGLTGLGSIVYALTRVGLLLGEETAFEIARAAAVLIDPEATAIDNSLDVFNGQAGAILGLLALYNARPDSFLLDTAIGCGNRILACHAQSQNATIALRGGLSAGFVRGPAGVAHALFRLHRVTNQEQFLEAAWDLMPVAVAHGEWNPKDGSWLTGAAGLGLAWLANVTSMDQAHASIETALDACLEIPLDVSDQVCRGIAGRFDLLIEASQTEANRSGLLQLARKHAAWSIQRAARDGGFRLNPKLPVNAFLPGFYEGSAGVGYQLLRLAFPGVFPSVLLWS